MNKLHSILLLAISLLFLAWNPEPLVGQSQESYTASGSHSFTVPAGVTEITVRVWGAGGAGGSGVQQGQTRRSGGGGGGGAYQFQTYAVTPGQTINITVGAGGSSNAAPGGSSQISFGATTLTANGGAGGTNATGGGGSGSGGAGGTGGTFNGGNGAGGAAGNGGGGGGSAGTGANGNNASGVSGGTAVTGGGAGGNGTTTDGGNGNPGGVPGGGGGGGRGSGSAGGAGANGQVTISWSPPDASESSISASPDENVIADNADPSTITITVRDENGDVMAEDVDVFFAITSGTGSLSSGPWQTNSGGQATATLTSGTIGTVVVTGYLGTNSSGPVIGTASVDFVAAGASQLSFGQQPVNTQAGQSISPAVTVRVEDGNGNLISGDNSTQVTIAIDNNPASGTLSGTTTVTASNGIATFSNLSIDEAGSGYTLEATATGLDPDVSSSFNITSAPVYTITGTILDGSSNPIQSVSVAATGGHSQTVNTNSSGVFTFTDVEQGAQNITITPTLSGYTFSPTTRSVTGPVNSTVTNQNFTGTLITYTLTLSKVGNGTLEVNGTPYTSPVTVNAGTTLNLEAIADSGWEFDGWTGDLSSTDENESILMNGNKTVTGTFSPEPTPGVDIRLQYRNGQTNTVVQDIRPYAILFNDGSVDVNLTDLTFRYWFVSDAQGLDVYHMDNALVGKDYVTGDFGSIGGQHYLEVGFTSQATIPAWHWGDGTPNLLTSGGNTGVIESRVRDDGWDTYDQSTHYSWDSSYTSYADYTNITVYYQGTLVWGTPPSGATEAEDMAITQQPVTGTAGSLFSPAPTVVLEDALGNPVEGVEVTVTLNKGSFAGGSTVIVTTNSSGEAVFNNLKINTADTGYQLTFNADASLVDNKTSSGFNINPAATDNMVISAQPPGTATAGASISPAPSVTLTDAFGNPTPGVNVSISLNQNAFDSGTTTVSTNSSGVAAFPNLIINTAASGYIITFDADASGIGDENSTSFTVNPAAAANMTIVTQPQESVTGGVIAGPPAVKITDAFGNPVSGINVTVSETGNSYTFDAGTLTRSTNSSGVATFNNLQIDTADTGYQLTFDADASGVSNVNSTSFDVVEAGGSMTVSAQPAQTTAGEIISPSPSVTLVDGNDDPIQGVDITVSLNQGSFASGTLTVETNGSGVAVFDDLVIEDAETGYEITFDADLTGVANTFSDEFDIVAADASSMSVTTQPGNSAAGNNIAGPPAVTIVDAFGNPVSGIDITVSLNKNSFASGTVTVASNSQGVASFTDLVINTSDTGYQLTFNADASGVSNVNSNTFNVSSSTPDDLAITVQPNDGISGVNLFPAPIVLITDANDNPVPGIDVTASLNKNNFTGGSTTIVTTNSSGLAIFDNLRINTVDTGYEITFSATGLTPETSDAFQVIYPTPAYGSVRLEYKVIETASTTSAIRFGVRVTNESGVPLALDDLEIRYWFTSEPTETDTYVPENVPIGTGNISGSFHTIEDEYYLALSISSSTVLPVGNGGDGTTANLLPDNATTGIIEGRINNLPLWGNYNQSDDYSWDSTVTSYTDYEYINVYYQGQLVWGEAPAIPITLYSRQPGNWSNPSSWSPDSHSGVLSSVAPKPEDTVIIGGGHTITLTDDVTNNDSVNVNNTGILVTGTHVLSGSGTFTLASGGTLRIGSPDGIAASAGEGNIQTGSRSFHSEANYVYNGSVAQQTGDGLPVDVNDLTINNSAGVTALQSTRVNGTLYLANGSFIFNDGLSLIANTKNVTSGDLTFRLEVSGQAGYRLLSSPINTNFGNFLSEVLTQGFTGSSLAGSHQPNVLWYDETYPGTDNQRWRAPSNISNSVVAARGYHVYMFDEVDGDSRYNDPLPYTLEVKGLEFEGSGGEVDFNVTYTEAGDEGWNLVGNPFGAAIDWEHASWSKTNIAPTIYIWNPNTNQYDTWNGVAGDIADGIIAPFQGFWIKANSSSPGLILSRDAKTFGGNYIGKSQPKPVVSIQAYHSGHLQSTAHFSFTEDAKLELDPADAHRLLPPPGVDSFIEFYSSTDKGDRLAINNLPRKFGRVLEIPLEINAYKDGQPIAEDLWIKVTAFENIPAFWDIQLINNQTGNHIPVSGKDSVRVSMAHMAGKTASQNSAGNNKVTTKSGNSHARFTLRIDPGMDADGIPGRFELHQNYPNPFNPTTTFRFDLPLQDDVRLEIYDLLGRRVAQLVNESLPAGTHHREWDASALASGVYLSRLITSEGVFIVKLTLLK